MTKSTRSGARKNPIKDCGLLIRRPQVQSLLGPLSSRKQNSNLYLSLRALRERFGVAELMAVAS